MENTNPKIYSYPKKVLIAGSIIALLVVVLVLFKISIGILLLVLAAALIALFFHGFAKLISRYTPLKGGWALAVSIIISLSFLAGITWLAGNKLNSQVSEMTSTLPSTIPAAKAEIAKLPMGEKILERVANTDMQGKLKSVASVFLSSTFGILGDLYVVIFLALFFTADPKLYKSGIIKLVPPGGREKADEVMTKIGTNLQKWLAGKIFAMVVVFIMTSILLIALGIPMWLPLSIMAGLLNFIPNFGPLLAAIPATLIALTISPTMALVVALSYGGIQVVESNFITPLVQQKLIKIPPALIIFGQLVIGSFTGGWGLLLATPVVVTLMILVQELYVKRLEGAGDGG